MKKIFIFLFAAAATLTACQKAEVAPTVDNTNSRVVKFSANNLYSFDTKSMDDNSFVGIWKMDDANYSNVKYTIGTDGATRTLTATSSAILWGITQAGTATTSNFFSIYPYDQHASYNNGIAYTVTNGTKEEQQSSIQYALDFTAAAKKAAPGTGETPASVLFNYVHPFAKLVYRITNNTDDTIKDVQISGIYWSGIVSYTESNNELSVTTTLPNSPSAVSNTYMYAETATDYVTVTMPGTITPTIAINMCSGAVYTYSLASSLSAEAGNIYTAAITLSNTHSNITNNRSVLGTFTVSDWNAETNVSPSGQTVTTSPSYWPCIKGENFNFVAGEIETAANSWSTAFHMNCVGEGNNNVVKYKAVIKKTTASGTNIKFKVFIPNSNGDWWFGRTSTDGSDGAASDNNGWDLFNGGGNDIQWGGDSGDYVTIYFECVYSNSNFTTHNIYVKNGQNETR